MSPADRFCPVCAAPAADAPATCPRCASDLAGYWRLSFRPWALADHAAKLAAAGGTAAASRAAFAAVELDPRRPEFRLLLARLLGDLGELDEAIEHAAAAAALSADPAEADTLLAALAANRWGADAENPDPAPRT
jgi:predicted amidophosphoribosyltransferase